MKDWRVVPTRAPQFRAEVWAVAGALALAVVLGAVGGRSQARALAAAESARLASAYVQGMDARAIVMR